MSTRTAVVASKTGLHARPATVFAKAAAESPVPVMISTGGEPVLAGSLLQVMTLGVKHGDTVTLEAGDDAVLDTLVELLETDLDS